MAQLLVRNLEDEVVEALQRRAAEHNQSAEAEHREILRAALLPRQDFKAFLLSMPDVAEDADFERDRSAHALPRDVDL
jgi:plasmid stability protein